jgi:eukaryotic-like serine/threonine-protein kinase
MPPVSLMHFFGNSLLQLMSPQLPTPVSLKIPGRYVIGSAVDADVQFPARLKVESRHAVLVLESESLSIQKATLREPLLLNGSEVETAALKPGDEIRCGAVLIAIRLLSCDPLCETVLPKTSMVNEDADSENPPVIKGFSALQLIGRGSLGTVYKATQLGMNRTVAIKCIRPELQSDERAVQLFIREASVSTQLKHPRIVEYHGFGFSENGPYLLMEHFPSENLETIVWRHAPERRMRLAVKIVMQVLEALAFAHSAGIVHRDIKPTNILATTASDRLRLKVSDFGLAKMFSTAGHSGITGSNEVCGTLAYMSPEQITDSRSAKPISDVYSAVVCLYRLLTKQFPHATGSPAQMVQARMFESAIPVQRFCPEIPDDLAGLIDMGLCRSPEMRQRSALSLHSDLAALPLLRKQSG